MREAHLLKQLAFIVLKMTASNCLFSVQYIHLPIQFQFFNGFSRIFSWKKCSTISFLIPVLRLSLTLARAKQNKKKLKLRISRCQNSEHFFIDFIHFHICDRMPTSWHSLNAFFKLVNEFQFYQINAVEPLLVFFFIFWQHFNESRHKSYSFQLQWTPRENFFFILIFFCVCCSENL